MYTLILWFGADYFIGQPNQYSLIGKIFFIFLLLCTISSDVSLLKELIILARVKEILDSIVK